MPKEPKIETIPFHQAKITPSRGRDYKCRRAELKDNRSILVGFDPETSARTFQITRLDEDGKRSVLSFGLTKDASEALYALLRISYNDEADLKSKTRKKKP